MEVGSGAERSGAPTPRRGGVSWIYVIECLNGYLYVGETGNLHRRIAEHRGCGPYPGSAFVKRHGFKALIYMEECAWIDRLRREYELTKELAEQGLPVQSNWGSVTRAGQTKMVSRTRWD